MIVLPEGSNLAGKVVRFVHRPESFRQKTKTGHVQKGRYTAAYVVDREANVIWMAYTVVNPKDARFVKAIGRQESMKKLEITPTKILPSELTTNWTHAENMSPVAPTITQELLAHVGNYRHSFISNYIKNQIAEIEGLAFLDY